MNPSLYLAVRAAEFPAQALLRLRTDLAVKPVAVLEGKSPVEAVCALNRLARAGGAARGMTRLEAESIDGLTLLGRSPESEAAALTVFRECAARFAPRMEMVEEPLCASLVLDIAGTERLFGPPAALASRIREQMAEIGFRVSIAVSANFHTARLKALSQRGVVLISEGAEAASLERLPVAVLSLDSDPAATLESWGIRTLGELAALPVDDLVARLGPQSAEWHALASGQAEHAFEPIEPAFTLREFCDFDTPVEQIDSLLFVASRMIDCLVARASERALSLASLAVYAHTGMGRVHRLALRPAVPTIDRKFLLKLLHLELAAHPPQAAVTSLTVTAEAGQSSRVQLGLFAPQTPEPSRLDVTLARLKAIVGEERVGAPVLEDSHRPAAFRTEPFTVTAPGPQKSAPAAAPRWAMRRVRPPRAVQVQLEAGKPAAFRDGNRRYTVSAAYGPWRTSGCWWSPEGWEAEEWDVLACDNNRATASCLLTCDRARNLWQIEAFYD